MTDRFDSFVSILASTDQTEFRKAEIVMAAKTAGLSVKDINHYFTPNRRVSWGVYSMEAEILEFKKSSTPAPMIAPTPDDQPLVDNSQSNVSNVSDIQMVEHRVFVPEKDKNYVSWGEYATIKKIIGSEQFFPVYISGLSGNGKTQMIKHICASLKREYIRVQINPDTDEADLIGGFRLFNGSTVWQDGPIITAMKAGAIVLLDECDRGSNRLMALQGVLEGEPVLIKKTGELVTPAKGFNIIATGNTKGRGSTSGRYTFATIIDEAFLERFPVDIEQDFPKKKVLDKIFSTLVENSNLDSDNKTSALDFADELASWGEIINESFREEAIDETISVRRLVHIMNTYMIFMNPLKSINLGINRFDEVTKESFLDLYKKISKIDFGDHQDGSTNDQEPETFEHNHQ